MSYVAIHSFIQCLHLKATRSLKYTELEPVRRSRRGTASLWMIGKRGNSQNANVEMFMSRLFSSEVLRIVLTASPNIIMDFVQFSLIHSGQWSSRAVWWWSWRRRRCWSRLLERRRWLVGSQEMSLSLPANIYAIYGKEHFIWINQQPDCQKQWREGIWQRRHNLQWPAKNKTRIKKM